MECGIQIRGLAVSRRNQDRPYRCFKLQKATRRNVEAEWTPTICDIYAAAYVPNAMGESWHGSFYPDVPSWAQEPCYDDTICSSGQNGCTGPATRSPSPERMLWQARLVSSLF